MTPLQLRQARELCERAIDAPWTVAASDEGKGRHSYRVLDANGMWVAECDDAPNDAAFIAAARSLVPALLDHIDSLNRDLEQLSAARNELADIARNEIAASDFPDSKFAKEKLARIAQLDKVVML